MLDLVVIGAGPAGLSVSASARAAGLSHVVLDRGPVAAAITRFPAGMTFFSTAENLEVGGIPFVTANPKPTKLEALVYYRRVVQALSLPVRTFTEVVAVEGSAPAFRVTTVDLHRRSEVFETRAIVAATGAHDAPRELGVPGEDQPHVSHDYDGPDRAFGRTALVVGGRNSAVEAALDLWRNGARVSLSYRRPAFTESVKYWLRPDIENRIAEGAITAYMPSEVTSIGAGTVALDVSGEPREIEADFVYLLTGYRSDTTFLTHLGVTFGEDGTPVHDPATRETGVPGLYLAGRVCAGDEANRIFIENGREHGPAIVRHLTGAP